MIGKPARIGIDTRRTIGEISPLLFGGFAEHMGRCVYGGIYDPESPLADDRGFRTDVAEALVDQQYTVLRYPGGNFLSGYDWRDGVGPRDARPRRRNIPWRSIETNQFGTNEFVEFCREIGAAPMLGVNMGTGSITDAANLVEYCNAPRGTRWADLRVEHGYAEPHAIPYWCLGNEMDTEWQIGHLEANQYGHKALETAKLMKWHDPSIQTVLCGSSGYTLPTFPDWDRESLEIAWEKVDFHSIHYYAANRDNDTDSYLALATELESYVDAAAATLRYVKAKRRSTHDVFLSWDEWQVWYKDQSIDGRWEEAPHLSEEIYNLEDALVVAQWLNVFLRKSDVLKAACVAQVVNVISWLQTRSNGLLRQASYYPFWLVSNRARGRSIDVVVDAPRYETKKFGHVPVLDVSASYDDSRGAGCIFVVNRSRHGQVPLKIEWQDQKLVRVDEVWQVTGGDPKSVNTFERPDEIVAVKQPAPDVDDGESSALLPPLSFTVLSFTTGVTS